MSAAARSLCFAALVQVATIAGAQGLPPAATPDIAAGVASCLAATGPKMVDTGRLQADGWHSASLSSAGKPVATSLQVFSRNGVLLTSDKEAKAPICIVAAHLPDADTFDDVAFAIDKDLGVHGKAGEGEPGTIYFFPQGHIVQLQRTGTSAVPSVRIGVGYRP